MWKFYCSVLVYFLLLDLINTSYFQNLDSENNENKHNYILHMHPTHADHLLNNTLMQQSDTWIFEQSDTWIFGHKSPEKPKAGKLVQQIWGFIIK